jgi:hypothetical protein
MVPSARIQDLREVGIGLWCILSVNGGLAQVILVICCILLVEVGEAKLNLPL